MQSEKYWEPRYDACASPKALDMVAASIYRLLDDRKPSTRDMLLTLPQKH